MSSRSHSVFTIKLLQHNNSNSNSNEPTTTVWSKLSVVDLAGSERTQKTQTQGTRLKEAAKINSSLMTLGRCLEILRYNQQNPKENPLVIPFDSILIPFDSILILY